MMHRLLILFRFLLIATPDALRIREFYVTCFIGWLDSFSKFCFSIIANCLGAFVNGFQTFTAESQTRIKAPETRVTQLLSLGLFKTQLTDTESRRASCNKHIRLVRRNWSETGAHARLNTGCQIYLICMVFVVCMAVR